MSIKECLQEIINLIDDRELTLTNRNLLSVCAPLGDIFSGTLNPHELHEIAETALNLLIQKKLRLSLFKNKISALERAKILRTYQSRLPTQTWRSREQNVFQQFSTPPLIAYLMTIPLPKTNFENMR